MTDTLSSARTVCECVLFSEGFIEPKSLVFDSLSLSLSSATCTVNAKHNRLGSACSRRGLYSDDDGGDNYITLDLKIATVLQAASALSESLFAPALEYATNSTFHFRIWNITGFTFNHRLQAPVVILKLHSATSPTLSQAGALPATMPVALPVALPVASA